ncbi:MAG TPA: lysophospholipase [Candidatus Binatia bacterium]|jgi:alpha-beta hydrolase superfamily lysophospholipase
MKTDDAQAPSNLQSLPEGEILPFKAEDGLELVSAHYRVPSPRGRVLIMHGFAEHMGRYHKVVGELTSAGYTCHLFDLRGHGRSKGTRGHVSQFSDYQDDLDVFVRQTTGESSNAAQETDRERPRVERRHKAPLILFGHSLGGLIALYYVLHRPQIFDALAVGSPFLAPAFKLPPFANEISAVAAYVAPTLSLKSALQPEWLSHDSAVVEAYRRDPLVFSSVTSSWWHAVRRAQEEISERANEIRTPALFLLGDADRLADSNHSQAVFKRLGSVDKQLKIYRGFFHELLNEVSRERVIEDLIAWLDIQVSHPVPIPVD